MGKLKTLSGKEVRAILEEYGFQVTRQRGSHVMMRGTTDKGVITISVPDHKTLAPGTLSSIIRQSRVPREIFEVE